MLCNVHVCVERVGRMGRWEWCEWWETVMCPVCNVLSLCCLSCRYSEFHSMHQKLRSSFPRHRLPAFPRKILFGRSQVRAVAQQRMTELQRYLKVHTCACMCVRACARTCPSLHSIRAHEWNHAPIDGFNFLECNSTLTVFEGEAGKGLSVSLCHTVLGWYQSVHMYFCVSILMRPFMCNATGTISFCASVGGLSVGMPANVVNGCLSTRVLYVGMQQWLPGISIRSLWISSIDTLQLLCQHMVIPHLLPTIPV